MHKCIWPWALLLILASSTTAVGQPTGRITGVVRHAVTQRPLSGATVRLVSTTVSTSTSLKGQFQFEDVKAGTVEIAVSMVGFAPFRETEVVVRSGRVTEVTFELVERDIQTNAIEVFADAFSNGATATMSTVRLNNEEIRRTPSGVGDLQRVLTTIPSAVATEDQANDIIVRGGSPAEVGFYVDGLYTPNINHFPQQGATGGNVSIVNLRFVNSLSLRAGGFDASFGERASGIVEVGLREGNRTRLQGQVDFNMTGLGGAIEGPIGSVGSYMVSARQSWLDLIVALLDVGKAPNFGDVQGKIVLDLNQDHKLSLIAIHGVSDYARNRELALKDGEPWFGSEEYTVGTYGATWRALWSEHAVSNTAVSIARIGTAELWRSVGTDSITDNFATADVVANMRSVTTIDIGGGQQLDAGFEMRSRITGISDGIGVQSAHQPSGIASAFASVLLRFGIVNLTAGARLTYTDPLNKVTVDPRLQANVVLDEQLWLSFAVGLYSQELPPFLISQSTNTQLLDVPRTLHVLAGVSWLATPSMKLSAEMYAKEYWSFPMSANVPTAFAIDNVFGDRTRWQQFGSLTSTGKAHTYGVELLAQQRLADSWHGTVGVAVSSSRYRDALGVLRARTFDNRIVATTMLGWVPAETWMLTARWMFAGGQARTPIDVQESARLGQSVLQASQTNEIYLPAYHLLSIRADKRWFLDAKSITTYLMVVNAYNRRNARGMFWDNQESAVRFDEMWGVIPVFGVEVEF